MRDQIVTTLIGCALPFGVFGIGPAVAWVMQLIADRRTQKR